MSERKLASLWKRVIGAAIDVCILFVITYALCYVWTSNAHPSEAYLSPELTRELWKSRFITTWLIADLIYSVALITSNLQGTFGQKAVGIIVTKDDGGKVGYGAAIGRSLMSIVSSIFLKIGYIMAAFRDDKKTLHDLVADTVVIENEMSVNLATSDSNKTVSTTYPTQIRSQINESPELALRDSKIKASSKHSQQTFKMNSEKNTDADKVWEIVAEEFESESKKKGLYARCFSETNGDESKTRALYYKIRFDELMQERKISNVQEEISQDTNSIELQSIGEGRNGRQSLKDDECFNNGYYEKFMLNGYECFDLDNGKAMVLTPKRKIIYKNLGALRKSMDEQAKTGTFAGALIEIYL